MSSKLWSEENMPVVFGCTPVVIWLEMAHVHSVKNRQGKRKEIQKQIKPKA
jgi:hypothetical protein